MLCLHKVSKNILGINHQMYASPVAISNTQEVNRNEQMPYDVHKVKEYWEIMQNSQFNN